MLSIILSVFAIQVFSTLNTRQIRWLLIKKYYKIKIRFALLWAIEYSFILVLMRILNEDLFTYLDISILTLFGVIVEMYLSYCLYSCYILGETGRLLITPIPTSTNNIVTQPSDDIYVAREFKEIVAYPVQTIPPECEVIAVVDYTHSKIENNTN